MSNEKKGFLSASEFLNELTEAFGLTPVQIVSSGINGSLSSAITIRRHELNLTQAELAEKMGRSQSTISKWESGDFDFSVELLVEIADALDLEADISLKKSEALPTPQTSGNITFLHFGGAYRQQYREQSCASAYKYESDRMEM